MLKTLRKFPAIHTDSLISVLDMGLRTVFAPAIASRPCPQAEASTELSDAERRHAAALMRVNHVGEVCAQALYSGQSLVSRDTGHIMALKQASREEADHLAWCEQRIAALGGRKCLLNPVWYGASFGLGVAAGLLGEQWNLGFLAETEQQVAAHLDSHMQQLPAADQASRAIVAQMRLDEAQHAQTAIELGGAPLPAPVKTMMRLTSKVMTSVAYRI